MQVKHAIGKATLHKLPIYMYNEYMRLCSVSTLFWLICCLFVFQLYEKFYYTASIPTYNVFPELWMFLGSRVPVLLAMKRSMEICLL